ncbi:MAG: flippase-like domain-containing protein [Anaerolineales bacterium]|nr:flippase-like domain-containing protein [Anaerolineales bacterium]
MSPTPEAERAASPSRWRKFWPWFNVGLTAVLLIGGVWYLSRTLNFSEVQQAIAAADGRFIGLAFLVFILNGSVKAWRWRVLLAPETDKRVPYTAVFWAIWLGQFVNSVLPFLRLGEIGRAYAIHQQIGYSKVQAVSTMLIEKSLEVILLGLSLLVLIPLAILPANFNQLGVVLTLAAAILLLGLGLVTYKTEQIIRLLQQLFSYFPTRFEAWLNRSLILGLNGLSVLQNGRSLRVIIFSSLLITFLDIFVPYLLFFAFSLPLGFVTAVLINIAVGLATTPPTAPGELGIFEAAVFFVLAQLGQVEVLGTAVILSYAVIFHLCTLLPKIALGSLAAAQTKWSWRRLSAPTIS